MKVNRNTNYSEILGMVIGILGLIITIISSFKIEGTGLKFTYFVVLATETLVSFLWVWHLIIKYTYQKRENELNSKIAEVMTEIDVVNLEKKNEVNHYKEQEEFILKQISIIISNIKNASKLNNELCNRIPNINEKAYHLLEALQKAGPIDGAIQAEEIKKSHEEFSNGLFDLYKRYTKNLLNCIVPTINAYLHMKGISREISVSIKLFDKPLYSFQNKDTVFVYTAFRDKIAYEKHEREVGEEFYTVLGNSDFVYCLNKDHFIINNANKNSTNYENEHVDFDSYYNCAAVVALRVKQANGSTKFLGYLCCDTMNEDSTIDIFDKEIAHLLFAMAQLYSTFLDTLNSNWIDRMQDVNEIEKDFFELICQKTYRGKQGVFNG